MNKFSKNNYFKPPEDSIPTTNLNENPFIDINNGKLFLPSLFTKEEEEQFEIHRNFMQEGFVRIQDSVAHIYSYEIADDFNYVICQLNDEDLYWLKFIGRFKSVQKLQIYRQTILYPDIFTRSKVEKSLKKLFRYGLIWQWDFNRDFLKKTVKVFTLSVNGFRFLEYFFSNERRYFQPQNYFTIKSIYHIRFWETVDIYQLLLSLPIYKGFETFFNLGRVDENMKKNMTSPLQIAIELVPNQIENLVFFPALQSDSIDYYKDVIIRWNKFTENGSDLTKPINKLSGNQNILVFYTPTVKLASQLNVQLSLAKFRFPILLLVGSVIQKDGIVNAFYLSSDDSSSGLKQIILPNLIDTKRKKENDG